MFAVNKHVNFLGLLCLLAIAPKPAHSETPVGSQIDKVAETRRTEDILRQIDAYVPHAPAVSDGFSLDPPPPEEDIDPLAQQPAVSELQDVRPADWAYEALENLIDNYGCLAGYPDLTFRGDRPVSRYEFAAGLEACLQRLFPQEGIVDLDPVDLAEVRRLQEEFNAELETLHANIDREEARLELIRARQFSFTTRLNARATFALIDAFSSDRGDFNAAGSQTTFGGRGTFDFNASFTGRDNLRTRLRFSNLPGLDTDTSFTTLAFGSSSNTQVTANEVHYRFPIANNLTGFLGATGLDFDLIAPSLNPRLVGSSTGALSLFGVYNPTIFIQVGGAGAGLSWQAGDDLRLDAAYLAGSPGGGSGVASSGIEQGGLFNGTYSVFAQLTVSPIDNLDVAFSYVNAYYTEDRVNVSGFTGSQAAQRPFGDLETSANHFGLAASYFLDPVTISGWVSYSDAEAQGGDRLGDSASVLNWAVTAAIEDLGLEGGMLGVVFGQPPKLTDIDGGEEDPDTGFHFEVLYSYALERNIHITPGAIVVTNPEHDSDNPTIFVVGTRVVFTF